MLGSLVGATALVFLGGDFFGTNNALENPLVVTMGVASFYFPFYLCIFVVIGWPVFLLFRKSSRFISGAVAMTCGCLMGLLASTLYGGPDTSLMTLGFVTDGAIAAATCWWFAQRPNPSINTDAAR